MPAELYLDTARFGRMALDAKRADRGFAELRSDEGGSAHVEELLRLGAGARVRDDPRARSPQRPGRPADRGDPGA